MMAIRARGVPRSAMRLVVWMVRLVPMMAVMIATGSIGVCFLVRVEPLSVVGQGLRLK